jgi:hypothetical protein
MVLYVYDDMILRMFSVIGRPLISEAAEAEVSAMPSLGLTLDC